MGERGASYAFIVDFTRLRAFQRPMSIL